MEDSIKLDFRDIGW